MEENTVVLALNIGDLQVLNVALGEVPFKLAAPLVGKINAQLEGQKDKLRPPTPPAEAAPEVVAE